LLRRKFGVGADYSRPVPERGAGRRCDETLTGAAAGIRGLPPHDPGAGAPPVPPDSSPGMAGEKVSGEIGILRFRS